MTYWLQGARQRLQARQIQEQRSTDLRLFDTPRSRLTVALIATIAVVALLAFVLFPPQRLVVEADGSAVVVVSRQDGLTAFLDSAGVQRDAGDVLVLSDRGIAVERARPILVSVDGQSRSWRSRALTIGSLLDEAGIEVGPYDEVRFNGRGVSLQVAVSGMVPAMAAMVAGSGFVETSLEASAVEIEVVRAVPVSIVEDGRSLSVHTTAATLEQALREAGVRLGPSDSIFPSPATPVRAGMEVRIEHARRFTLHLGDSSLVFYTHEETLQAALAKSGLTFGPDDRVEPPLSVAVADGMEARVVKVTGRSIYESLAVDHVTVFQADESLTSTQTRRVEGSAGALVTEYRIVIEDGVEVEKTFVDRYYDPSPVDTVIYYAASALNSAAFAPADHQVMGVMRMYGTWYNAASSGKPPTHAAYGITRSGMPLTKGIVAVDPNVIPLGTRVYIPGYGFAIAADTGGGIIGDRVDLGYPDGVAVDWDTGWTDVYILTP